MADLLLTHGYFLWEDEKERQIMKPYPTLGLLYNSAYLRRAGFAVEIFDTTFSSKADLAARLAQTPGGVLGIYTNLITRGNVVWIIGEAKRHGWTAVSYTHLRAHETVLDLVCRLLLEKKKAQDGLERVALEQVQ